MYIPEHFRETRLAVLHELIEQNSFGMLVTSGAAGLFATPLPFLLDRDRGPYGTLLGHMARANPQWRDFDSPAEALALFQGPHAYVTPSWYTSAQAVPTWNYTAVHAYGRPTILMDPDVVLALLDRLVATNEATFEKPWVLPRPNEYVEKLMRGIVAFEMPINRIEGKQKLSQNRSEVDRAGVIAGLEAQADPPGLAVAALMRRLASER